MLVVDDRLNLAASQPSFANPIRLSVHIGQIFFEQRKRIVVKFQKIRYAAMAWKGSIIVSRTTGVVAPYQYITKLHTGRFHYLQ